MPLAKAPTFALLAAAASLSGPASASMVGFYLAESNTNPPYPNGTDYLEVTILDGSDAAGFTINGSTTNSSDVVFEVQTLAPLNTYAGTNFGIDSFAFNTLLSLSLYSPASSHFLLPSSWKMNMTMNADGFGQFDLLPKSGMGAGNVAEPLLFAITNVSGQTASDYEVPSTGGSPLSGVDFAAHVINLTNVAGGSAWFGGQTPVPLPAAAWLFLSVVGGLGFFARKRAAA